MRVTAPDAHRPRSIARVFLALAAGALVLSGCSPSESVDASALAEAAPEPDPAPTAVTPELLVTAISVSPAERVFHPEDRLANPADEVAINQAVSATQAWIGGHLADLISGGSGTLASIAAPGMLDTPAAADLLANLTTKLAAPGEQIASLKYDVRVFHDGAPEWLEATVFVTHADGRVSRATMTLVPDGDALNLIAAEAGPV